MKTFKHLLLISACLLSVSLASAQWSTSGSDIYNTNTGNVGVGTSSPIFKFSVLNSESSISYNSGNAMARFTRTVDGSSASLHVYGFPNTSQLNSWDYLKKTIMLYTTDDVENMQIHGKNTIRFVINGWWDDTYEKMRITSSGTVGIGTSSPSSTYKLDVAGSVRATGGFITSDERYKKDIRPLKSSLQKIKQLDGMSYYYRADEFRTFRFNNSKQIGLIAQNVQKVFPELVSKDDAGFLSVNYTSLIPVIIESIKEQDEIINSKNKQIETLEARLLKLETTIANIMNDREQTSGAQPGKLNGYPNPANSEVSINFETPGEAREVFLNIFNQQGLKVDSFEITDRGKGTKRINLSNYPSGTYFYHITSDGKVLGNKKMVVQ